MGKICSLGFKLTKNQKKRGQKQSLANLQNFCTHHCLYLQIIGIMKYISCQHIFGFWILLNSSKITATEWEVLNANPKKAGDCEKFSEMCGFCITGWYEPSIWILRKQFLSYFPCNSLCLYFHQPVAWAFRCQKYIVTSSFRLRKRCWLVKGPTWFHKGYKMWKELHKINKSGV